MSTNHPEPEVRELAEMAERDMNVLLMVNLTCTHHGVRNLTELFAVDPDVVFELHDEVKSMIDQLGEM